MKHALLLTSLLSILAITGCTNNEPLDPNYQVDFAKDVQPILEKKCYKCHAGDGIKGKFSMETQESFMQGGRSGKPPVIAGDSANSRLVRLIDPEIEIGKSMPPKDKPLKRRQIDLIAQWIDQGAAWSE